MEMMNFAPNPLSSGQNVGVLPNIPQIWIKMGLNIQENPSLTLSHSNPPKCSIWPQTGKKNPPNFGHDEGKKSEIWGKIAQKGKTPEIWCGGGGGRELEKIKTFGHKKCLKYNIWEEKGIKSQNLGGKRGQKPQKWGGEKSKKSEIWEEKILNFCPSPNNEENQEKTGNEASPLFPHSPAPELLNSQNPAGTECFSPNHSFYT